MSQNSLHVLIPGATGRMGQMVRTVVQADPSCQVAGLLAYQGHGQAGQIQQPESLILHADFDVAVTNCSMVIDFSLPEGCAYHAKSAAAAGVPIVIGTTGLDEGQHAALQLAAKTIPVFWAPNMSVGIALMRKLVTQAAENLSDRHFDIEIVERHHRNKIDSPSGTAIALGQAVALGRGLEHDDHAVYQRPRQGAVRDHQSIGYAAVRGGAVVGDHDVHFMGEFEELTISHHAVKREVFAAGAVRAAKWLITQPAGLYNMDDLLA